MNKLILSCQKATELVEKKQELKLANREKIQLILHLGLCNACSNYQKQSVFIDEILKTESNPFPLKGKIPERKLSPIVKQEILKKLEEN